MLFHFTEFCVLALLTSPVLCWLDYAVNFPKWYSNPDCINLGLFTENSTLTTTCLWNGTCFQYNPPSNSRCRYYSDCCSMAPIRAREQLPKKTFSCHDGIYIIDRCPANYPEDDVKMKCNNETNTNDISLERWPVRGTTSDLIYKNVYCAICHGLDPFRNQTFTEVGTNETSTEPDIEWLTSAVYCDAADIQKYLDDKENIATFIKKKCFVNYMMERSGDLCFDAIRTCSDQGELNRLCEEGPASYIRHKQSHAIYRNQFCSMCSGHTDEQEFEPPLLDQISTHALGWSNNRLRRSVIGDMQLLANIKLTTWKPSTYLSTAKLLNKFPNHFTFVCFYREQPDYDMCFRPNYQTSEQNVTNSTTRAVWDLGSVFCFSQVPKVCDAFILKSTSPDCSVLGCSDSELPDLVSQSCVPVKKPNLTIKKLTEVPHWHGKQLCDYLSSCKVNETIRNCHCDELCQYYSDCCIDSEFKPLEQLNRLSAEFRCLRDFKNMTNRFLWGFTEVFRCPGEYPNNTLKEKCEYMADQPHLVDRSSLLGWPVSDMETGVRYRNVFCAKCNDVQAVVYWKAEFGFLGVMNDRCSVIKNWDQQEVDRILQQAAYNGSSKNIREDSYLKQFIPPDNIPLRRCRVDHNLYISTCPEHTPPELKELCESGPASFIYDAPKYGDNLKPQRVIDLRYSYGRINRRYYEEFYMEYKFRNSHCVTCHGASAPACLVYQTRDFRRLKDEAFYQRHWASMPRVAVIYRIDLNERTCEFDSDYYLTYQLPNGRDSCEPLQEELRQCNCSSTLNIKEQQCILVDFEQKCQGYVNPDPKLSAYASWCIEEEEYQNYNMTNLAQNCSDCTTCGSSVIVPTIKNQLTFQGTASPNVKCAAEAGEFPRCPASISDPERECIDGYTYTRISGSPITIVGHSIAIGRTIAVTYSVVDRPFQIAEDSQTEFEVGVSSLFVLDDKTYKLRCTEYVPLRSNGSYEICKTGYLKDAENESPLYQYYIDSDNLYNCSKTSKPFESFKVGLLDYILTSCSLLTIAIYLIVYLAGDRRSLSETFFCCSIATLFIALLLFCVMDLPKQGSKICTALAVLIQYAFICTQTWTTAIAIWIYRGLVRVRLVASTNRKVVAKYSTIAWLTPLLPVTTSVLVHVFDGIQNVYLDKPCFLGSRYVKYGLFVGPIQALTLTNVVLCVMAAVHILRSSKLAKHDKMRAKKNIFTCCKLMVVFGLHWLLIFFVEIPQKASVQVTLLKIIQVVIELQGVTAVVAHSIKMEHVTRFHRSISSSRFFTQKTGTDSQRSRNANGSNRTNGLKTPKEEI